MMEWHKDLPTVLALRNLLESMGKSAADLSAVHPFADDGGDSHFSQQNAAHRRDYEAKMIEEKLPLIAKSMGYKLVRVEK